MKFIFVPKLPKLRKQKFSKKISKIDKKITKNNDKINSLIEENQQNILFQKCIIDKANSKILDLENQFKLIENLKSK
jgi:hypothetical protein